MGVEMTRASSCLPTAFEETLVRGLRGGGTEGRLQSNSGSPPRRWQAGRGKGGERVASPRGSWRAAEGGGHARAAGAPALPRV